MATTFAVPDGRVAMAATTYTGNGSTQSISNAVNTVSFQPDFIWFKGRNTITNHLAQDVIRGAGYGLNPNATNAEANGVGTGLTAFGSSGFSLSGDFSGAGSCNSNGITYVGWQWKAGGTAVSNTAGTITSSVSANTTAGFSVVTYTGNGSATASYGHGLGTTPQFIISKSRNNGSADAGYWDVYHVSLASQYALFLQGTNAAFLATSLWASAPSSTVVNIGNGSGVNAGAAATYVAYCWAPVAGYSAFGSYTGNGSADGPFIYTGFRPRWLMIKRTDAVQNWIIVDTSRDTYNVANKRLFANLSDAEDTGIPNYMDMVSNGFKCRDSNVSYNASGGTYIYAAFAENPLKFSNAR
jgi:hypothetical protein